MSKTSKTQSLLHKNFIENTSTLPVGVEQSLDVAAREVASGVPRIDMMVAAVSTRERWVLVRVGIFRGSVVVGVVRLAFVVRTRLKGDQGKM